MTIFNVFTLMGGIAMFLYGMDLMGSLLRAAPEIIAAVKNNGGSGEPPTQR